MTTVTIVQLYPEELGVAGDRGNVMALSSRLASAGIQVTLVQHRVGDSLSTDVDLVLVGNGPLSAMRNIYADLESIAPQLHALKALDVPFFAYGSGAELLGHSITLLDDTVLVGFGLFPFTTTRIAAHKVGYVVVDSPCGQIVGFEDNASVWKLDAGALPFGTVYSGSGTSLGHGVGAAEGVRSGASIATQIGGPVLPLNPALTDALICAIAERRGIEYLPVVTELDSYAANARGVMIANAKVVFSRI